MRCATSSERADCLLAVPAELREAGAPAYVHKHEVSVQAFAACLAAGRCDRATLAPDNPLTTFGKPDQGDYAINGLSYAGAEAVCAFLGGRVPTAREWLALARAGDDRAWAWGPVPRCPRKTDLARRAWPDDLPPLEQVCAPMLAALATRWTEAEFDRFGERVEAWPAPTLVALCEQYKATDADALTATIAQTLRAYETEIGAAVPGAPCEQPGVYPPSMLAPVERTGMTGLSGNVAEWTSDPDPAGRRAVQGGSWMARTWDELRLSQAVYLPPEERAVDVGVRCVGDEEGG